MRALLSFLFASFLLLTLTSCSAVRYTENFSSIMVGKSGPEGQERLMLVVVSEKYHYLFEMPPLLEKTLESDLRQHVRANFNNDFDLDGDTGEIKGSFILSLANDASAEEKDAARKLGYRSNEKGEVWASLSAQGRRFAPGEIELVGTPVALSKSYRVSIEDSSARRRESFMLGTAVYAGSIGLYVAYPVLLLASIPMMTAAVLSVGAPK